ncbi:diguanylate cyclase [Virgisporangium aurantiacum]|uniref:diguanylate cyclase n=1 Tax=Virgisporangium aurantiacum TaxID=175570 RepID=UPI001952288E|nr:diguanylate cyclase [Virgisporangium aurantiacum]
MDSFGADLEVLGELGRGAYATVYRARRHGVDYALKAPHREVGGAGDLLLQFRREAALLARLDHPGAPRPHDVGQADGRPYLVMDLIEGSPLAAVLEQGPIDEAVLVRLGWDVAGVLAAAHSVGLVHRDIKPSNIVVASDGIGRLIDFGLADRDQIAHRDDAAAAGTFDYSAPEQTGMLRRAVDGRADLYSLGVVLFECATGTLPFVSDDVGELMRLHAVAAPPDPRVTLPELSPGCAEVIGRLLAKDPDDRYQSADDLRRALAALMPAGWPGGDAVADPVGAGASARLIGRAAERADLRETWQRARTGTGGIVLVSGATGTGKSMLARELVTSARADGALTLAGKCDPDEPVPLGALRTAIDRYVRSVIAMSDPDRAAGIARVRAAAGAGAALLAPLSLALAEVLAAPAVSVEDRSEQLVAAVAELLTTLARSAGGLVLHLDDVQWADPATRRVLRRLAGDMLDAPLLLVATAREGAEYQQAVDGFCADAGDTLALRVTLGPLDDERIADLVSAHLGGTRVGPELAAQLAVRGGGNPFATLEYLHALVDAGALYPNWGVWQLDADLLEALRLPADVLDLVLARVDGLGDQTRDVLMVAAAVGSRFPPDLVAEATGLEPGVVFAAVREAIDHRLVETAGAEVGFVHDRIREALLLGQDASELRRVHQRLAEALDARGSGTPDQVYAVAAHYAAGETDQTPEQVYYTGLAAGRLALVENAHAAAVAFLEPAAAAATAAGIAPDSEFREAVAQAYLRTGRLDAAKRELGLALDSEREPLRRAALLLTLSNAQRDGWELTAAVETCREGLATIGHPMPRNSFLLVVSTLWALLLAGTVGRLGWGRLHPTRTPPDIRERVRLRAALNISAMHSSAVGVMKPEAPFFGARVAWPATRLGISPVYVEHLVSRGMFFAKVRQWRRAERVFARAATIATTDLRDPKLAAGVVVMSALAKLIGGIDDGQVAFRVCEEQRRWLDTGLYLSGVLTRCQHLVNCGHARQALTWYEHGLTAVAAAELPAGIVHGNAAVMAHALLGDAARAATLLDEQRRHGPDETARLVSVVLAAIQCAYERGDFGEPFEAAIAEFDRLGVRLSALFTVYRTYYVYLALGRLAQCHQATPGELPARLDAARRAVRQLQRAANGPLLRGYAAAARAGLLQLRGEHDKALTLLARHEPAIYRLDAPAIGFEMARIRARALGALGVDGEAQRQAEVALALATRYGWTHRARWVRTEFGVAEAPTPRGGRSNRKATAVASDRSYRRLEALQQVSLAAARVLDPHELSRVALDQTLTILGAERALLFLPDSDATLRPVLGRDRVGHDMDELAGYSSSLVERVAVERAAIVITGTEEGAAVGSHSAVVYGLRSIMIAPMEIDGRLIGAVYLDSRVAKGVFTDDDVEILSAISHHVATSLETARAAQLDAAVQVARRQRDIAETLRQTMTELTGTLQPDQVIQRLLEVAVEAASADWVGVLLREDGALTLTAPDGRRPFEIEVAVPLQPESGTASEPVPAYIRAVLGPSRCWLAVPLSTRSQGSGVLIAGSGRDAFTDAQIEITAAIVRQGATAYDNATLFAEVQRLAITDGLTGIANRRHFTDLATRQLDIATRNNRPVTAMMLDIDHFKRVNDTYGHSTGDEVIRTVARVLAGQLRDHDIVGRLGGEEFAVLLPEMHGDPIETANRVRATVEATTCAGPDGPVKVTISVGLTDLKPDDNLDTLLNRADEALYRAKQSGRNRVQVG